MPCIKCGKFIDGKNVCPHCEEIQHSEETLYDELFAHKPIKKPEITKKDETVAIIVTILVLLPAVVGILFLIIDLINGKADIKAITALVLLGAVGVIIGIIVLISMIEGIIKNNINKGKKEIEKLKQENRKIVDRNREDAKQRFNSKNNFTTHQYSTNDIGKNASSAQINDELSIDIENQNKLKAYMAKSDLTNWELGLRYERFVGYLYENKGYAVKYNGATEKYRDQCRDIIAVLDGITLIIQCKYWASYKLIYHKEIDQLYGSVCRYKKHYNNYSVKGVFFTNIFLSEEARAASSDFDFEVIENQRIEKYPLIKCKEIAGEKLYFCPYDYNYDNIQMNLSEGDFYTYSISEATKQGYEGKLENQRSYDWWE